MIFIGKARPSNLWEERIFNEKVLSSQREINTLNIKAGEELIKYFSVDIL